jgi:hypothetical protein
MFERSADHSEAGEDGLIGVFAKQFSRRIWEEVNYIEHQDNLVGSNGIVFGRYSRSQFMERATSKRESVS